MKLSSTFKLFISVVVALASFASYADRNYELSLNPPTQACKKHPKSPPYELLHKSYSGYGTVSNHPFINSVDINGDGWCDWVSTAAAPPHRFDEDEPSLKDFIFLGTKTGWRTYGKKGSTYYGSAYGFIAPTFIYSSNDPVPYVATLYLNDDTLQAALSHVQVARWSKDADMLQEVSQKEKETIIDFLKNALCKPGNPRLEDSIRYAICNKQSNK